MKKVIQVLICFVQILWGGQLQSKGTDTSIAKVVSDLKQTYERFEDFQTHFEQVEENNLLKRQKKTSGIIYALRQGRIFWHTQVPTSYKIISDGKKIWQVQPGENDQPAQVTTYDWDTLDAHTKLAFLFLRREAHLPDHFEMSWKDRKRTILLLKPKKKIQVDRIEVQFSKDPFFFQKMIFYFPLERKTTLIFQDIQWNQYLWNKHQKNPLDVNIDAAFQYKK